MTQTTDRDPRAEYIAGLRMLADALEANTAVCLPYDGAGALHGITVIPPQDGQREQLAAWARALPGKKTKEPRGAYFDLTGAFRGLHIKVICDREEVCERVVTGTREVEVEEPDPAAVAALPTVKRTKVVEDVRWICRPVLGDGDEGGGAS